MMMCAHRGVRALQGVVAVGVLVVSPAPARRLACALPPAVAPLPCSSPALLRDMCMGRVHGGPAGRYRA